MKSPIVKTKYSDNFSIKIVNLQEILELYNKIYVENSFLDKSENVIIPSQNKSILKKKSNLKAPNIENRIIHIKPFETNILKNSKSSKKSK